jgi:uncharacterized protein YodC (DUF2158 family)
MAFNVGDTVKLKSAKAPLMSVFAVPTTTSPNYICVWFRGASREQGTFKEAMLELVP